MQTNLKVGAVDDPLEHEADRVADQVMRMPAPAISAAASPQVSRKCAECEQEKKLQMKPAGVQIAGGEAPAIVHQVLRSPGQPLDAATRSYMEPRFGHDFSHVRVHHGTSAEQSASALNAHAYAVGNNIVFGAGRSAPETNEGRRLIAHELAHVVQQGCSARQPVLRRSPDAAKKPDGPDPAEAAKEPMLAVAAIEANWKLLSSVSAPYALLKPWRAHGDAVVALIQQHTTAALAAITSGDNELMQAYMLAIETDKITYDFVAWHVTAYVNLLALRAPIEKLVESFDHDKRAFTGRANAERIARDIMKAAQGLQADSDLALALVRRDIPLEVRGGTNRRVSITVTSPAISLQVRETFRQSTADMQTLQANVQRGADVVNQFLDSAFEQGLEQAGEALVEYALVRAKLGGDKKRKEEQQPQPQPQPVPQPVPVPIEDDKKKPPAAMRFQVQWNSRAKDNTKGQFSEVATAPASIGVSTAQAVTALNATHAKVTPEAAKKAAGPAVALQVKWINGRPPAGVVGQFSRSEYFKYQYPDARVDVEGLRGHNLRR
ncbi:MAG: hypothetical protein QOJ84_5703 [Bradyrhizobium sp.]|jgi:hypothetical protein|nr:hypothetical protein [Bradyrhizobium sp.]